MSYETCSFKYHCVHVNRFLSKRSIFIFAILLAIIFLAAYLITRPRLAPGQAPQARNVPTSVDSQLMSGAPIYAQTCATSTCHGGQGEGIRIGTGFSAWPLTGSQFQSRHPNAEIVFDVVRSGDEPNLRGLTDQQIYNAIAYELSRNQIALQAPLTASNAFFTFGGLMSGRAQNGLFPPSDNIVIRDTPPTHLLPFAAENDRLRIQVDQLTEASAIGNIKPPVGGAFLIFVFAITDLDQSSITVSPDHVRLTTPTGEMLQPQSIDLHSAIEKFHVQTIKFEHGTAGWAIFTLSAPEQFDQLIYDDQAGNQLKLNLKP